MSTGELELGTIVSAPFEENTYVARLNGHSDCLVIDPGLEPQKIVDYIQAHQLVPVAILNTHGHSDHIAGNAEMKRLWPAATLVIGRGDAPKLTDPHLNLSAPFGLSLISPPADLLVVEGDQYRAAGFELEVHEIPGHSCGHVVFVWRTGEPMVVFGGDVLFAGSIGRFDFPDGDFAQLAAGIRQHLFSLPDDTIVLPGHGPTTTVGVERRENPYVGERSTFDG